MESYHCPICNSDNCKEFLIINYVEAGDLLSSNKEKRASISNIVKSIWKQDDASFVKCNTCQFAFSHPFIAGNGEYYSLAYNEEIKYPTTKWEYEKTIQVIQNLSGKDDLKLLEIGAGDGAFLSLISPKFIKKENIVSTEYSESGLEKIEQKGIKCLSVSIEEVAQEQKLKKFDVVCMFQVLEHIDDIHTFLKSLNELLNHKAKVFIAIPNALQREFYDKHGIYYDIPPTHIGRYHKETIEFICSLNGWKLRDFAYEPMSYKKKVSKFYTERYSKIAVSEKIEKINSRFIKILLRYILIFGIFMRYLNVFIKLKSNKLGTSSWFYIEKE